MRILVVADPLPDLLPGHDTSVALMEAAQDAGHDLLVTTLRDLSVVDGRATAHCLAVTVTPATLDGSRWHARPDWWRAAAPAGPVRLDDVDVVLVRTDPPVDAAYLRATYLLDAARGPRTLLVNDPRGLRDANEKLFTLRFPDLVADTVVTADPQTLTDAVARWGVAVLKPTDAMAGRGILLLRPDDPNLRSLLELSTQRGAAQVILQRFLPAVADGDRRVIVVDGDPVGAVRRIATGTEFRCNMAAGARVVADSVTARDKEICEAIAPELGRLGIVLAGLDVIGDRLTEVNVTSPTGAREIEALSGVPVARIVMERIAELHARRLQA